jgi:hypothetical protein
MQKDSSCGVPAIPEEENPVQELPEPFNKVLEEQKAWRK